MKRLVHCFLLSITWETWKDVLLRLPLFVTCTLLLLPSFTPHATAASVLYSITDLGTLPGGSYSSGYGINASGDVVGSGTDAGDVQNAFVWHAGQMTALGNLGGETYGYGINASDQATGISFTDNSYERAFLYSSGTLTDLGTLGGDASQGFGINDAGDVVGWAQNAAGIGRATLWHGGVATDLGTLGGTAGGGTDSEAAASNDAGQIVGDAYTADGSDDAFLWQGGQMTDLGSPGGGLSRSYGINSHGQVVGVSYTASIPPVQHAFLWTPTSPNGTTGTMEDLGALAGNDSIAYGINDAGTVVGASTTGAEGHAVVWQNGVVTDLNSEIPSNSGWVLTEARGINDAGQIVATGTLNGAEHAVVLTPTSPPLYLSHRYVVFLDGINSCSFNAQCPDSPPLPDSPPWLKHDFGDIENTLVGQLQSFGLDPSRFVYFSYGAAAQAPLYCKGWVGASLRPGSACSSGNTLSNLSAEPTYSEENTHLNIKQQAAVLTWLLNQVPASASIDIIGYSLGGVVADYWAAHTDPASPLGTRIHSITTIESPVGGLPGATVIFGPECNRHFRVIGECVALRQGLTDMFGPTVLDQLRPNTSASIVSSLPAATQFAVTSIQSTNDYLVNQTGILFCTQSATCNATPPRSDYSLVIGKGTQGWTGLAANHTTTALGGIPITWILPADTWPKSLASVQTLGPILTNNHGSPLHYTDSTTHQDAPTWVVDAVSQ